MNIYTREQRKKRKIIAGIVVAVIAIIGIAVLSMPQNYEESVAPESITTVYSVSFNIGDTGRYTMLVEEGECPTVFEPVPDDNMRFVCWTAEDGEPVSPESIAAFADTEYYALFMPALDRESVYLFADGNMLYPDELLSNEDLNRALDALGALSLQVELPDLETVTQQNLYEIFAHYFCEWELKGIINDSATIPITRGEFAVIVNNILGRNSTAGVVIAEEARAFLDVGSSRTDYSELMEAAQPHAHAKWAAAWNETVIEPAYPEGFILFDSCLHYIDAYGQLVVNDTAEGIFFDSDGRQTSGDETLDTHVRDIISELSAENPEADRLELLHAAYIYTRDSFTYLRRNIYEVGEDGWQIADAITMIETGRGNCYSYAAVFCALARGLGYDARAISSAIGQDYEPHGWVVIEFDDIPYIFDPELEMAKRRDGFIFYDFYMMAPNKTPWPYYDVPAEA